MQIYKDKYFKDPIKIIDVEGNLREAFKEIENLKKKYYILGYITYDFKKLYFEVFDKFYDYKPNPPKQLGTIIKPCISKQEYIKCVKKIKEYIKNGITYEVNYTYPCDILTNLNDIDLFEALLYKQKTPYNTFIKNKYTTLLSFSPELFFKLKGNKILTKPMKGTIKRNGDEEDEERKKFLYNDIKNRSENIMIVDLIRNDLGRIGKIGSVCVDKLFDIEEHPTVFQMTSEISAEIEDGIDLYKIFEAIFPCGSITGAPKISTMKVIKELEQYERNIYCGAIGFLSPEECEFSVPIRILYGNNNKYKYHTGGAIVWDSDENDEWEETIVKRKFLETDFYLIETAVDDWSSHIKRMKNSAKKLGFKWNEDIEKLEKFNRILLEKDGSFIKEEKNFKPIKNKKIRISRKVNSNNPFLYHKTNIRYTAESDFFDEIAINERGEVTEGTFTNIAVQYNNKLYTPPISSGLLNGTYRKKLIEEGLLTEKILYQKDLEKAEKIYCFNSVRKMVEVELCL